MAAFPCFAFAAALLVMCQQQGTAAFQPVSPSPALKHARPLADSHSKSSFGDPLNRCESRPWQYRSSARPFSSNTGGIHSLQRLVEDVKTSASKGGGPRTIFVGGKGGVGKTTVSAALAVSLAAAYEDDLKVLVVSTDPAHSLGDALDQDLRSSRGKPVVMTDPLTGGRLNACEIDSAAALDEFRSSLAAFDVERLAEALGVKASLLEGFGLREFSGLLNNPPPGLDELVALANVLDPKAMAADYDVVIVDTAPTGHTLRLLALPKFLDGLLGKLIKIRMKLSGLANTIQAIFGSEEAAQRSKAIDDAAGKLEEFQKKMAGLRSRLQDSEKTTFTVVTIPTALSVAESKRLMTELDSQGVAVTDVVVNRCVSDDEGDGDSDRLESYYARRKSGQQKWIGNLQEAIDEVSASEEFKSNGGSGPIALTEVPFFDVELVGVPALAYVGRECFNDNPNFSYLMNDSDDEAKVLICGGKGGVGKTTTAASLAVSMAAQGHNVALISTDPAHSLGDAIDMNLAGGALTDCALIGVPPTEGSLSVMEIDPTAALSQFKNVVDELLGSRASGSNGKDELGTTLRELGEIFDTLPAGTDEVVALAKVINLIKKGNFDRIVLDTSPTGHTLRMLSTPGFIADLIDRVLAIAHKVNSNAAIKMLINSSARGEEVETAAAAAKSTLLSFQLQMYDLEDLFSNPDQTEFLIVTVPTELAVRESVRLLNELTFGAPDMPIKVRNVVANQILSDDDSDLDNFVARVREGQATSTEDLMSTIEKMANPPEVTKVPYLDTEPRGVFGLQVLAGEMLKADKEIA